jgi:hypothetical protein
MKPSVVLTFPAGSRGKRVIVRTALALRAALLTVTPPASASAEDNVSVQVLSPSPRPSDQAPATRRHWYGYQTVIADALSTTALVSGLSTFKLCISVFGSGNEGCQKDNTVPSLLILGGTVGYALGGPVIHAAHGHWDKAGYSLAIRVLPTASALAIGSSTDSDGALALLLVGGGAAMIVDGALLSYETVAVDSSKLSLLPSFDPKSRAGALVVGGSF